MKPLLHAKISAKKHGGSPEDYMDIHEWFDQTKAHVADMRHRAILHNSFGIYLCAQVFGEVRTNSAGLQYSVRDIAEDHILEDVGIIPALSEVIQSIDTTHLTWLGGVSRKKKIRVLAFDELEKIEKDLAEKPQNFAEAMKLQQEKRFLIKISSKKEDKNE